MMKSLIYCVLVYCVGLSALSASEDDKIQVEFRVYLWPGQSAISGVTPIGLKDENDSLAFASEVLSDEIVENYDTPVISYLGDGVSDVVPMFLNEGRLSELYKYRGPPLLEFFKETRSLVEGQDQVRIPLARVSVSPAARELILLLFPSGGGRYNVLPVESDSSAVKPGHAIVYNLTDTMLSCTFGGPVFELQPKQSKLQALGARDGNYQPILAASQDDEGEWKRRIVRKLSIGEGSSMLFIIYNPARQPDRFKLLAIDIERDEPESM